MAKLTDDQMAELLSNLEELGIPVENENWPVDEGCILERLLNATGVAVARKNKVEEFVPHQFSASGDTNYPAGHLHTTGERVKRPSPAKVKRLVDAQMGRK